MTRILFLFCLISQICFSQKIEYFSDSKTVIKPNEFKLNIIQKNNTEESIVYFELFKKSGKTWKKIQIGNFKKQENFPLNVSTDEDLNNDGYNDVKISFAQAGRGSNELNKLLVFNPITQKLVEIINSQDYPNLHYNAKRNCVSSYSFSGGNSTYFLKINNNRLQEFARVYFANDSVSSYKIKNNEEILLKKKAYKSSDAAVFFSDFDPIEE